VSKDWASARGTRGTNLSGMIKWTGGVGVTVAVMVAVMVMVVVVGEVVGLANVMGPTDTTVISNTTSTMATGIADIMDMMHGTTRRKTQCTAITRHQGRGFMAEAEVRAEAVAVAALVGSTIPTTERQSARAERALARQTRGHSEKKKMDGDLSCSMCRH
jgi:hypothetical protein